MTDSKQGKVLIVDDSKLARMVIQNAFRRVRPEQAPSRRLPSCIA